jgi:DNA-binding NarL/FixJ family response regulator
MSLRSKSQLRSQFRYERAANSTHMTRGANKTSFGWQGVGATPSASAALDLHPSTPFRLALIDDDEETHRAVREMTETQRGEWILDSYLTARSALHISRSRAQPDAVLMDILMPGFNGIECTRRLKAVMPELPIVIFTACSGQEEVLRSVMAGACGYLIKPVAPQVLLRSVRSAAQGASVLCAEAQNALIASLQSPAGAGSFATLSRREREILPLLLKDLREKEVAERLGVAASTVHTQVKGLYKKLGVHSRAELLQAVFGLRARADSQTASPVYPLIRVSPSKFHQR